MFDASKKPVVNVTLEHVAREAGVHTATAATILNGAGGNTRVSAETRARVMEVAARLGYRPNRMAQSLRRQKSHTIGLLGGSVENPFFAHLATRLERVLLEAGYELVMAMDMGLYRDDRTLLETLISRGVDGIVYWNGRATEGRHLAEAGVAVPVTIIGYPSDQLDSVAPDFALGADMAVRHLAAMGRKRIAYFCPSESRLLWTGERREAAYREAVLTSGGTPRIISYESALFDVGCAREAAETVGRSAIVPDALFCFNDIAALGAMMGFRRAGLTIPEDVALAGFDNIPLGAELDVPLTTLDMPIEDVCQAAVQLITKRLGPTPSPTPQRVNLLPKLIVRASSGVPGSV
jgi:DNA-binding LacI/PurR family transcriptional regulator